MRIYLGREGKVEGPYTLAEIRQRLQLGTLEPGLWQGCLEGSQTWQPLRDIPGLSSAEAPSGTPPPGPESALLPPVDGLGKLIPTRNPCALVGYYLSILGLVPCLGLPLALAALVLGIIGLRRCDRTPGLPGRVHAWVAILLGGFTGLLQFIGLLALPLLASLG